MYKRLTALLLALTLLSVIACAEQNDIEQILKNMTLEEKVGQMFLARCPATDAQIEVAKYSFGGYVMFANSFENRTPDTFREYISAIQAASKLPLIISIDEEGGTITRASRFPAFRKERFPSPQELFRAGGPRLVIDNAKEKSEFLLKLGINANLCPVADVSENKNDYIYARTLGEDAELTASYVGAVVEQMNKCGIGCSLKHFPGYGGNTDTHEGFAIDKRDYEAFAQGDLLPFIAGISAGAGSVMVSHNIVNCMDAEYPASLSTKVHRLLREGLGFEGVIISDALEMDAIDKKYEPAKAAVLAVQAGNDLLCTGSHETQIPAIISAVKAGTISEEHINRSVLRILKWKQTLGLI